MKVLLDETIPEELAERMSGFNVLVARRMGMVGKSQGAVLREVEDSAFDVVVTADRRMKFPGSNPYPRFGIVVLDILPATEEGYLEQMDRIRSAILGAKPGVVSTVRWPR